MSITDELREYVGNFYLFRYKDVREKLNAIADNIDAEYQKAEDEWKAKNGDMWLKGYSVCHEELMEGHPVITASLEEAGWVRLPKDAEGVPWHIGDVIAWPDGSGLKSVIGIGKDWLFYVDGECEYKADWTVANDKRHAPTVEDVLREFADRVCNSGHAEYAAKLRLADGVDA